MRAPATNLRWNKVSTTSPSNKHAGRLSRISRHCTLTLCLACCLAACRPNYTPKPMGYFRIDLPEVPYVPLPCDSLPYSFHVAEGVRISSPARGQGVDLRYPAFGAELYCSYAYLKPGQLGQGLREGRALAERQAKNPLQMHEQIYTDSVHHVYASLFDLGGESASPYQFLITDSGRRLFQGALLYDCRPNADSLRPVNRHLQADIRHLIETFRWKN